MFFDLPLEELKEYGIHFVEEESVISGTDLLI